MLSPSAPAFSWLEGTGLRTLSCNDLASGIKWLVQACGMDPAKYATHSLRRGGAPFSFRAGALPFFIQHQGSWSAEY